MNFSAPTKPLTGRIAAATAVVAALALGAPAGAGASPPAETLGVFRSAADPGAVAAYEGWIGHPVSHAMTYFDRSRWEKIESPDWWLQTWSGSQYRDRMVYSVPIIPDSGGSLAAGAGGAYNGHFRKLAANLVAHGQGGAILRLGWEFNGDWYRWSAARDPAAYAAYWRQIVTTMRSVPGARLRFEWTPNLGTQAVAPERAYPGDGYVDFIGLDAYDQDWLPGWQDPIKRWHNLVNQPHGLAWHRDFAAAHGKPMAFGEWGLIIRPDGHGGGDNPHYIRQMHAWIAANRVAYHLYFEASPPLTSGRLPRGAAAFRELFGGSRSGAPATAAPSGRPSAAGKRRAKHKRRCKTSRSKSRAGTKGRGAKKKRAATKRRACAKRKRKRKRSAGKRRRPVARSATAVASLRRVAHQAERERQAVQHVAAE